MRRTVARLPLFASIAAMIALVPTAPVAAAPGDITTYAGSAGQGPALSVAQRTSVVAWQDGLLYIGGGNVVHALHPPSGNEAAVVGFGGSAGNVMSFDGQSGTKTQIINPRGLAFDSAGNLLMSEGGQRIRRIMPGGDGILLGAPDETVSTILGTLDCTSQCSGGFTGDGGPVTAAQMRAPGGMAFDSSGNLYVADTNNHRIRKITPGADGLITGAADEIISTVAGSGPCNPGCAGGFGGDGGSPTAAQLNSPTSVHVDSTGNLYIADTNNHRVRFVNQGGAPVTLYPGSPQQLVVPPNTIVTLAGNPTCPSNCIGEFGGDGGPATAAKLNFPRDVKLDPAGNLLIGDTSNGAVRRIQAGTGIISTVAGTGVTGSNGDGGAATAAQLRAPTSLTFDPSGTLYIADEGSHRVRKVVAGADNLITGAADEIIMSVAGNGTASFSGDGGPAPLALLSNPDAPVFDRFGNLFFSDRANLKVRRIDPAGFVLTVVGGATCNPVCLPGSDGDGGPASAALVNRPEGLAFDGLGNLYVADSNSHTIRRITPGLDGVINAGPDEVITTVAGTSGVRCFRSTNPCGDGGSATAPVEFDEEGDPISGAMLANPVGVSVDEDGNLLIADVGTQRIRRVEPTGKLSTYAGTGVRGAGGDGGPAAAAQFNGPIGVLAVPSGDVFVTEQTGSRIRRINPARIISKVAGDGTSCNPGTLPCGDGGPATAAKLGNPFSAARDPAGNLFISDEFTNRIRKVDSAGIISTVAGTGLRGFSGDGGPATAGMLNGPRGVAVSAEGDLFIADTGNDRIRRVSGVAVAARAAIADFKGNGGTDVSVFRPSGAIWYVRGGVSVGWGDVADVPVPADYDGDGITDIAIFRPSTGLWALRNSTRGQTLLTYGVSSDVPVPADYDGDGKADIAIFRPATGLWAIHKSSGGDTGTTFGIAGDVPVPADYDGDGKVDIAVFRNGAWHVRPSAGGADIAVSYGTGGDIPVVGDYDGDGRADIAIYRPATGLWALRQSSAGDVMVTYGGISGDMPVPGDFDADNQTDIAIFRPAVAGWFVRQSLSGADVATTFGIPGDVPLPLSAATRLAFFP